MQTVQHWASTEAGNIVKEWCACGAAIRASKREVVKWRATHLHPDRPEPEEPDKQGAHANVELSYQHGGVSDQPVYEARIGFQRRDMNNG